jgi:hypothetical protein
VVRDADPGDRVRVARRVADMAPAAAANLRASVLRPAGPVPAHTVLVARLT